MTAGAYYNEIDPFAADWLRGLIAAGLIAPGDVDERDIQDVRPADLVGYGQCHFFAGIGGWPFALRIAGWPDDRPVWTGSCPCQPLSSAGQRKGHADERHLWPAFHGLIAERRPPTVFGEQVASKDGREWFAAVRTDLEKLGHAVGAADLCAAGVGAPHIRQRLFWVADAQDQRPNWSTGAAEQAGRPRPANSGSAVGLGHAIGSGLEIQHRQSGDDGPQQPAAERAGQAVGGMDDAQRHGRGARRDDHREHVRLVHNAASEAGGLVGEVNVGWPGAHHGGWGDADWLFCTDGRWRPVEPGAFPLAHGVPGRVGQLRAYGNAIVPQVAAEFIQAFSEILTAE